LNDLFKVIDSTYEELDSERRIVTMIVRDPLLQVKNETRLLFEKRMDANGPIIILSRAAYNGVEAENDSDLHQTAKLIFEGSLNARNNNKK